MIINPNMNIMRFLVAFSCLLMLAVNFLANALPINGLSTGAISAKFDNLFTPAGAAFSIWGLIYILLLLWVISLFVGKNRDANNRIGGVFIVSSALNALWIVAWHHLLIPFTVVLMLALLASIVVINKRLKESQSSLAKLAFGIYLGWICVATIANITIFLVYLGWEGWVIPPAIWAIDLIATAAVVAIFSTIKLKNPFIALPVAWALLWIAARRINDTQAIAIVAIIALTVLMSYFVFFLFRQKGVFAIDKD